MDFILLYGLSFCRNGDKHDSWAAPDIPRWWPPKTLTFTWYVVMLFYVTCLYMKLSRQLNWQDRAIASHSVHTPLLCLNIISGQWGFAHFCGVSRIMPSSAVFWIVVSSFQGHQQSMADSWLELKAFQTQVQVDPYRKWEHSTKQGFFSVRQWPMHISWWNTLSFPLRVLNFSISPSIRSYSKLSQVNGPFRTDFVPSLVVLSHSTYWTWKTWGFLNNWVENRTKSYAAT